MYFYPPEGVGYNGGARVALFSAQKLQNGYGVLESKPVIQCTETCFRLGMPEADFSHATSRVEALYS